MNAIYEVICQLHTVRTETQMYKWQKSMKAGVFEIGCSENYKKKTLKKVINKLIKISKTWY